MVRTVTENTVVGRMKKGDWVYVPSLDLAGRLIEDQFVATTKSGAFAEFVIPPGSVDPITGSVVEVPIIRILWIVYQGAVLLDKIIPFLVRWFKILFGPEEESKALLAQERAKKATKSLFE
jgi:hypothetical protein